MIDPRFRPHNTHLDDAEQFETRDPTLNELARKSFVYRYPLLDHLPADKPGIYTITGGRQIGKSTVLKQRMADLLKMGVEPSRIVYYTGELIDDHHTLVRLLTDAVETPGSRLPVYCMVDEITFVREWERAVKYLADAGLLNNCVLILTGSDSLVIRQARMRLPGRRGSAETTDFHLFPLSFYEFVRLKSALTEEQIGRILNGDTYHELAETLNREFEQYLLCGGYLTAINDMESEGHILPSTFAIYSDWIRGDILRRGKQEQFLREIFTGIIRRYGTQITWNSLAKELSIEHPATVADYIELLCSMDVLFVQYALQEDRLRGAPKKARKVVFNDPFIFHSVRSWLLPGKDPFSTLAEPLVRQTDWADRVVEACAVSHHARYHPTYYIKAEGEVDIAYVERGRFWPLEIKWTGQIRPKDLKQVAKYANSGIATKAISTGRIHGVPAEPLVFKLLRLGPSPYELHE
jgi:predicted AAA+ superfamily ATPase